jgi:DNA-binding NarL/FixJ family response regulator
MQSAHGERFSVTVGRDNGIVETNRQGNPLMGSEFCIVAVTGRPSVAAFFGSLARPSSNAVTTTTFDFSASAVGRGAKSVMGASVAVVDASIDPVEALDICLQLRTLRADLRIGVLFCCPHAAMPDSLRPFLAASIGSFLDLQLSAEQMLAALRGIARGETVVRIQLREDTSKVLFNGHDTGERLSDADLELLRLVALGSTDHEIGVALYLSHHTVKHRIERLRSRLHARNRIQLAAVAGRLEGARAGDPA